MNIKELLSKGVIKFQFKKVDGSIRTAVGTTNLSLIDKDFHPKGIKKCSDKIIPFFDLEKNSWRSLKSDSEYIIF